MDDWDYSIGNVSIAPPQKVPSIDEAARSLPFRASQTIYYERGSWTVEKSASVIARILSRSPSISSVDNIDQYRDIFGRTIYLMRVSGQSSHSLLSIQNDYKYLVNDINFFGSDFGKITTLGSKAYSENEIAWTGLLGRATETMTGRMFVACDDADIILIHRDDFVRLSDGKCNNGIALSETAALGISGLLSYKFSNQTIIPILPTALSSIFLTGFVYLIGIYWLLFPIMRGYIHRFTDNGEKIFSDNMFKITYVMFILILSPIVYIFSI